MMATSTESGNATTEMMVVRVFIKNRNRMITTNIAPSMSECCMLEIELLMKLLCRKVSVEITTSSGRVCFISSRQAMMLSVSRLVSTFGCLVIVTSTAGFAFSEPTPRIGVLAPTFTVAMSLISTVPDASLFTTEAAISLRFEVLMLPLMVYSLPYSYKMPPPALLLMPCVASSTCCSDTP